MDSVEILSGLFEKKSPTSGQGVLVQVSDMPQLIKSQGELAHQAYQLLPGVVTQKAYQTIRDQLDSKLKEQGVLANVTVVDPVGFQPSGASPIWKPLAVVFGVVGIIAGHFLWKRSRS